MDISFSSTESLQKWDNLNPPGFKYKGLGADSIGENVDPDTISETPGFTTEYSKYNIYEDRADLYSRMKLPNSEFQNKLQKDSILQAKSKLILSFLESNISIDENFFPK